MIKSFINGHFLFVVKDLSVSYVKPCILLDELVIKTKIKPNIKKGIGLVFSSGGLKSLEFFKCLNVE